VSGVANLGDKSYLVTAQANSRTLYGNSLLAQTSALHLFGVRPTPVSMQMMPATAWGVAEPIYQS
jgi:hypothetical protein